MNFFQMLLKFLCYCYLIPSNCYKFSFTVIEFPSTVIESPLTEIRVPLFKIRIPPWLNFHTSEFQFSLQISVSGDSITVGGNFITVIEVIQ